MDWVTYLAGKGYTGRRATGSEVTYPCFFDCNEPADSRKRKLYVNADTGLYSCKVCVSEGNHITLMRHFGEEPERDDAPQIGRRSEVLECATAAAEKQLVANDDALEYLLGPRRHLAPETIVKRRLGFASRQWPLSRSLPEEKGFRQDDLIAGGLIHPEYKSEFFRDVITIPYIYGGRVVQVRGKDPHGRYYTPIGDAVYLYNADALKGATEAILVEGEFDCMMLEDLLATSTDERIRSIAVIGLAGTGALPEDFDDRLKHLKRIYIATDPDGAGRKAAEKIEARVGQRSHVVEWPADLVKSWIAEHGNGEFDQWGFDKALASLDWTTWIGKLGAHVDQVSEMFRVQGRLKSAMQSLFLYRARPTSGMKTGFTQLDAAFLPGILPGQVVVMLAKTGVGKTLLLCNLAYNLRQSRVLFVTLEMTAEEIWVRIARIYRFYEPFASDESVAAAYANLRICDANKLTEEEFALLVEEYTEDVGAKPEMVFVDYLGYYAKGFKGGSSYEKTTDAIMQLKAEAKSHQVAIITPAQVNRGAEAGKPIDESDARDSGAIEETADLLVGVWRSDDALDAAGIPSGKLHLKILKSRHGNLGRVFLMQMGLMSLVIVDDISRLAERARRESQAVFSGQTYDVWLRELRNNHPSHPRLKD